MRKKRPFVNLFLDESTLPNLWNTPQARLKGNGIVVFQTAIAHYSESKETRASHFKIVDISESGPG